MNIGSKQRVTGDKPLFITCKLRPYHYGWSSGIMAAVSLAVNRFTSSAELSVNGKFSLEVSN
jgi:hypothetical protein